MKEFIEKLIGRLKDNHRAIVTNDEDLEWNRAVYSCTEIVNQLAEEYKDAEEQGLLLKLPCKVGDTVYVIGSLSEFGVTEEIELKVFECMVNKITLNGKYGNTMQMDCKEHSSFGWSMNMRKIDELVFLTKAEAEQTLKQMGE